MTLLPNVPNPFNPETLISFGLPSAQVVTLKVYDINGRLTRTLLADAHCDAGYHSVNWDGRDEKSRAASSGVYFYVLETDTQRMSGKMTLLK